MELLKKMEFYSKRFKDKLAYVVNDEYLTYGEIWSLSYNMASWFYDHLNENKKPIVIVGHKDPLMITSFLAAVRSGHAYVPCDHSIAIDRLQKIIELTKTECVINLSNLKVPPPEKGIVLEKSTGEVTLEQIIQKSHCDLPDSAIVGLNDDFYIMFTSGTTGVPKGVRITTGCVSDFIDWMAEDIKFSEAEDCFLNQAPFSFDLSDFELFNSLYHAGTIYSITDVHIKNPIHLFKKLYEMPLTVWISTPSFIEMCLCEKTFDCNNIDTLKKFIFCGEVFSHTCASEILRRFPSARVYNTYGPTEATCATASIEIDQKILDTYDPLPIGYAKPRTKISILKDGKSLPDKQRGEIIIIGPNVSPGYFNAPQKTTEKFFKQELEGYGIVNGYHTGDQGYIVDNLIFYNGRIDTQIKLYGHRIELEDIENNIRKVAGVENAIVLPYKRNSKIEYLVSFIIWNGKEFKTELEWISYLKNTLTNFIPQYMIPKKFIKKRIFPINTNGKVNREKLLAEITQ